VKLKPFHASFVARKIALELLKSGVSFNAVEMQIYEEIERVLASDMAKEKALEARVNELLDEREEEIEASGADKRSLFSMMKKQLAAKFDFEMDVEERYENVAFLVFEALKKGEFVAFSVSENRVKNVIFEAILSYINGFESAENAACRVLEKKGVKFGTSEWEVMFGRIYEDELRRLGLN